MTDAEPGWDILRESGAWWILRVARACDDIIGVYEPLVHLGDGFATRTSRAAEPEICSSGDCFHLECYERLADDA